MLYEQIIPFCRFFKGEILPPTSLSSVDVKLWAAEQKICEDLSSLIEPGNPRLSLAEAVHSYVGKWAPYEAGALMERYLDNAPDLKDQLELL